MADATICQAELFDAQDRLADAACAYEKAIRDGSAQLVHYLNLMVLYCESQDPGVNSGQDLAAGFASSALKRLDELPGEIETRFGVCEEAIFWRELTHYLHIAGNRDRDKWLAWVEAGLTLVPLIALPEQARSGKFAVQLKLVRGDAMSRATMRGRLIVDMIENFSSSCRS